MPEIKTSFFNSEQLPLVIEPTSSAFTLSEALDWIRDNKDHLKQNLLQYGGILFRNFPIESEKDFGAVIKACDTGPFLNYIGGDSPRKKVAEGIYTSTEAPPSFKIPLHNELSYMHHFPRHIYFYCQTAPKEKGETILGDARRILKALDPEVKKRFQDKQLYYLSCYQYKTPILEFINRFQPVYKSWINVFETSDKAEVEKICREHGIEFKWNQNDWLQIAQLRPATITHPITNEEVWFNQAHHFDFNSRLLGFWRYLGTKIAYFRKHMRLHEVYFGDKTSIPKEDIYHILDVMDQNTLSFPWQKGDVLLLDNILSMHGRASFSGPRRVLASMT